MENIELVIKIPDEIRLALINNIQLSLDQQSWSDSYIKHAIVTGIILPKGHGDLIDRQELLKSTLCKTFGLRSVDIENAPTIIEAERGDEV